MLIRAVALQIMRGEASGEKTWKEPIFAADALTVVISPHTLSHTPTRKSHTPSRRQKKLSSGTPYPQLLKSIPAPYIYVVLRKAVSAHNPRSSLSASPHSLHINSKASETPTPPYLVNKCNRYLSSPRRSLWHPLSHSSSRSRSWRRTLPPDHCPDNSTALLVSRSEQRKRLRQQNARQPAPTPSRKCGRLGVPPRTPEGCRHTDKFHNCSRSPNPSRLR